jgi:hypothetical protein
MYKQKMALGVAGASVLLGSALLVSAAPRSGSKAPSAKAMQVRYTWRAGSVPPPYHYSYTIALGPGARGQMWLRPAYEGGSDPVYTEKFAVAPAAMQKLRATMISRGVFSRKWEEAGPRERPVGGPTESLKVSASGREWSLPTFPQGEGADEDAQAVRAAVNAVVPAKTRARLMAKRDAYEKAALEKQNG